MKKSIFIILITAFIFSFNKGGYSAILYKEYLIFSINSEKFLCARHIVQKGEFIYKILKQRGNESGNNLYYLKMLNPHLHNINLVEPGQPLLVPLKKLQNDEFENQSSGRILIPFITKKPVRELLKENTDSYQVQSGDTVSKLISKKLHAKWGTQEYNKAEKLFKYLNPDVQNLNVIVRGENLNIPKSELVNKEWYPSLFNPEIEKKLMNKSEKKITIEIPTPKKVFRKKKNILEMIANSLDGDVQSKGELFIPFEDKIFNLRLKKTPFIQSEIAPPLFFLENTDKSTDKRKIIKKFYNKVAFFSLNNKPADEKKVKIKKVTTDTFKAEIYYHNKLNSLESSSKKFTILTTDTYYRGPHQFLSLFSEYGLILPSENRVNIKHKYSIDTSSNQRETVRNLLTRLNCKYNENTSISFPYRGVQIKAVTNIAENPNDKFLVIDFSEFYGDTIESIKRVKMDIVQILKTDSKTDIINKVASGLGYETINSPIFPQSVGSFDSNIKIQLNGVLLKDNFGDNTKFLFFPELESSKFPEPVLYYLDWLNLQSVFL